MLVHVLFELRVGSSLVFGRSRAIALRWNRVLAVMSVKKRQHTAFDSDASVGIQL